MAPDSREPNFEKALARQLRANQPATSDAAAQRCPDAEILAAYHERELPAKDMTFWKEHVATCSHCKQVLAHLAATDSLPVNLALGHENVALVSAEHKPAVLQISKRRPVRLWFWLAPAGAIAAGFLVWIALEQRPKPIELAKNEQPRSLADTVSRSEALSTPAQPAEKDEREKAISSADARSSNNVRLPHSKESAESKFPRPSAPPPKDQRDDQALRAFDQISPSVKAQQPVGGAAAAIGRLEESNKKQDAPAPMPQPPPPPAAQSVEVSAEAVQIAPQAAAPSAPEKFAKAKAATSAAEPESQRSQQLQQMEGMSRSRLSDTGMMLLAKSKSLVVIATLNKKVSWRVGRAGSIERSEDVGATWSLQTSGVITDLLAGSAPSESVCWVVGQLGTVLRTTDAGATWTKLPSPVAEDILSVFAVSAQQATVSTAHATYQTTDAGATWTKLAPE